MKKTIENIEYNVNRGSLKSINEFKEFVGEEKFDLILKGFTKFDLSFNEDEYQKLLSIILMDTDDHNYKNIPYHHTEELVVFFCEPFAGKYLKQAKYTLAGISSLLQNLDKEKLTMLMESTSSLLKDNLSSDVLN